MKASRTKEGVFMELLNEWHSYEKSQAWLIGREEEQMKIDRMCAEWVDEYRSAE